MHYPNPIRQEQQSELAPHLMTLPEFKAAAQVVPLTNHERKWNVSLGSLASFSDAASADEALIEVHRDAVKAALDRVREHHQLAPQLPPASVIDTYPDLANLRQQLATSPRISLPPVTEAEFAALITGLRLLEDNLASGLVGADGSPYRDLLTDAGAHAGLAAEEVGALCDRIQFV